MNNNPRLPQMPREGLSTVDLLKQLEYRVQVFTDPRDKWVFEAVAHRLMALEEQVNSPWNVPLGVLVRGDLT